MPKPIEVEVQTTNATVTGRNGTVDLGAIKVWGNDEIVFLEFISAKTRRTLNAGANSIPTAAIDEFAQKWLAARG